jgi:type IV secretion system protein VirB9
MRRIITIGATLLISGHWLAQLTGTAFAEATPSAGPRDARVRHIRFEKDQVVAIDATFGISTMIVFGDGEKIESIAVGDSVSWKVEPNKRGNIIFLKPVEANAATNMNVVTDKRLYSFVLKSNERPSRAQVYKVRFRFPDDEADARLLNQAKALASIPSHRGFRRDRLNTSYAYKGSEVAKPLVIFDDGTKTWFRFSGEVPAIFIVDAERNESLVNYRREGDYLIVDKIAYQWTVRNGEEVTCLFNQNQLPPEPTGVEPYGPKKIESGFFAWLGGR